MHELTAYSTVAVTLGLVVARPRVGPTFRIRPYMAALAGVLVLFLLGIVKTEHFVRAATNLWSPFVAIGAIMIMTEVAHRVGLLDFWASRVEARARSTRQLFALVFGLGVLTSASLNNDAAILLLTPAVVALVRRRYPNRKGMVAPFAFAVFMSAGVAAMPVSNPMNMVVSEFSGIGFNTYTLHMLPVAVAGWVFSYLVLRRIFRRSMDAPMAVAGGESQPATKAQWLMMGILGIVLLSYPILGLLGGPVWAVASGGAVLSLALARWHLQASPVQLVHEGVSWGTLAFLLAVLILSMGLFEVGLVDRLSSLYQEAGVGTIGVTSALGSAVLNNHPMSHLNMMALESAASGDLGVFAALVGGDLGPRLLPMGSLAGLLWLDMLRRRGVDVGIVDFVKIGFLVAVPCIAVSLAILALY